MARYWISFDLGLRGDYSQLYEWLDRNKARECGDSLATIVSRKTRDQIARELKEIAGSESNGRIYLISMKEGGKFVAGARRVPPWAGYAQYLVNSEDKL